MQSALVECVAAILQMHKSIEHEFDAASVTRLHWDGDGDGRDGQSGQYLIVAWHQFVAVRDESADGDGDGDGDSCWNVHRIETRDRVAQGMQIGDGDGDGFEAV